MSIRTSAPRLNCEQLESRDNPAGNVSVAVFGGVILLQGDDFNNRVQITQNPSGDVFVIGLDNTTVNGLQGVFLGGIPTRVDAVMGAGNDRTEVVGMTISGDLNINAQVGNDSTIVFNSTVGGSLRMFGSEGNDENILTFVRATHLLIDGGSGLDGFHIDNTFVPGLVFIQNNEFQF